jgi:hypothetical protein
LSSVMATITIPVTDMAASSSEDGLVAFQK